ncbi:MAG: TetR/AcrR family transcriptional regulator [Gammaproteobacteria bacterium]|nr:TetR/AcrR family transcriptional regulator [Gammaproteobacteria bacterium]MBQ0838781.1 TetR/AcrR family transcriptional regulator [Gammaproteobacteria bacterium]
MPRPPEYNRIEVVNAAMQVFWAEGYESSSIQKLLGAMQLNRGSLYSAFGDKEGLFLEALDLYVEEVTITLKATLWSIDDPLLAIRSFLESVCLIEDESVRSRGCLLFNSISEFAHVNPHLADEAEKRSKPLHALFEKRLSEAQSLGLIDSQKVPKAMADYLLTLAVGLRMHAKMNTSRDTLQGIIDVGLSAL